MSEIIPLFKPAWCAEEIEAVSRVMQSGWWGMGPETEKFEEEFATYTQSRYAIAVNSGTMALELAAKAVGLTQGLVVVPALTFISTALAMKHAGNVVEVADIEEDTLCLNWASVKEVLDLWYTSSEQFWTTGWPRGVVPVHYAGHVPTLPGSILLDHPGLHIIEDCAHAAGSQIAGMQGEASAWSFHAVKNLATGDGGMVTTNDADVAKEVRRLRWCGIDKSTWERDQGKYGWDYDIPGDGYKAHMNDITAAIGRVQLKYLDERNMTRRGIAHEYSIALQDLEWLKLPMIQPGGSQHLYVVRVPAEHRNRFIDHMLANGVSAGVHYKPLTSYLPYGTPGKDHPRVPVTNRVWKTLVTLPMYPAMTEGEIEKVIETVRSFKILWTHSRTRIGL